MPPVIPLPFATSFEAESINGKTSKTGAFQKVETALQTYVRASSTDHLLALTRALGAWKLDKVNDRKQKNWTDSVRAGAVRKLSDWLIDESQAIGLFPTSRSIWNSKHNCYAYAMKCQSPKGLGQMSWTGKLSGKKIGINFAQGVVEDGLAQDLDVVVLPNKLPQPMPPRQNDGSYLVAMVSNGNGFHFLRRRESTGLWTHKNGGASPVDTYFYDQSIEQPLALTDEVVARILENPKLIGCSMTFDSYLRVPAKGMLVQGGEV